MHPGYSADRRMVPMSMSIRWRRVFGLMSLSTACRRLAVSRSVPPEIGSASRLPNPRRNVHNIEGARIPPEIPGNAPYRIIARSSIESAPATISTTIG